MNSLLHATVSAIYPLSMIQLAIERGVPAQRILKNADVSLEQLHKPSARISTAQQAVISYNLVKELNDPSIGLELGLRSNITKIGLMGFGLMSCATFGEVSSLGGRYLKTRVPYFSLSQSIEGSLAVVLAREELPLGPLHQFGFDYFMAEVYQICHAFATPRGSTEAQAHTEIWFDSPEQPYYAKYADRLPRLRFGMPSNQFRFSAALLDVPIPTANPISAQMAFEECEREMALLGYTQSVTDRVLALLTSSGGQYPNLDMAARRLNISSRTLKRKLAEESTSFGDLLEETRRRESLQMLLNSDRTIDQIAGRVGYADPANFRRAFKRWTGRSPSDYRIQQLGPK